MIDGRSTVRRKNVLKPDTGKPVWALGTMTGTSMDGLDLALLRTDGETIFGFGPSWEVPLWPELSRQLRHALPEIAKLETTDLRDPGNWPDWLRELQYRITRHHGWAIEGFQLDEGLEMSGMDSRWDWMKRNEQPTPIGVHGQTVLHRPEDRFTLQLLDPRIMPTGFVHAEIVSDFRSADMKAGGQGAPLAPFYHFALARHIGATEPLVFLNIGGVANITWVDPRKDLPEEPGALIAFDTGPGNALVNDWMGQMTGAAMDRDGEAASAGTVHRDRLGTNSGQAYLDRRPPKSLDRNDFHGVLGAMTGLSAEDGAATLTAFTAECVAASQKHMPAPPARWLVCGGGRLNATMMRMLQDRLEAPVGPVEAVGLDGDMLEAQAFAYLAVRVLRGLPTSAPSTTGCREPVCGGRISYPS